MPKRISRVFLKTDQGEKFKIAHEPIKALGRDAIMFFTEQGLEVISLDNAACILTRYVIKAESIRKAGGEYYFHNNKADGNGVPNTIAVAVETTTMSQCLKYVNPGDTWTLMWTEENPTKLTMLSTNGRMGKKRWDVNTVNPQDINPKMSLLDRSTYSACIMFKSLLFHAIIRDLTTAETLLVQICCDGHRLVFSSQGILIRTQYEINDKDDVDAPDIPKTYATCGSDGQPKKKAKGILTTLPVHDTDPDEMPDSAPDGILGDEGEDESASATKQLAKGDPQLKKRHWRKKKGGLVPIEECPSALNVQPAFDPKSIGRATFDVRDHSPEAWPSCNWYVLSFLQYITKARQFSDTVKIYVKKGTNSDGEPEDFPILIAYDCANFGSLEFLVGPRVPSDEDLVPVPPCIERKMPDPVNVDFPGDNNQDPTSGTAEQVDANSSELADFEEGLPDMGDFTPDFDQSAEEGEEEEEMEDEGDEEKEEEVMKRAAASGKDLVRKEI